jgi:S1-C subfamily serine protease
MNPTTMILCFIAGIGVAFVGQRRGWSVGRQIFTSFIVGALISSLFAPRARSSEVAFERLRATTVHIAAGSGSIVEGKSGRRYILTNAHVCNAVKWKGSLTAHYQDGKTITGRIAKSSWAVDLCAAEVKRDTTALKQASRLLPLQKVYTRGYPGHVLSESEGRVGFNIEWSIAFPIEAVGECPKPSEKIRDVRDILIACGFRFVSTLTTLYCRPGSSGSPVTDANGELVGVVSSMHTEGVAEAGMVRFSDLQKFLGDL